MLTKYKHLLYEGILILVAIIWGSGFIATKLAVNLGASPVLIMSLRFLVASLFITVMFWKDISKISKHHILGGMITGLFLCSGFMFQTYGIKYTTPSKNAFLTAVNVVIVPFLYWLFYKHKPKNKVFIAAIICVSGVGLLTLEKELGFNIGDAYTLVCAFLFAGHIVANGHFIKKISPIKLTALQMYFALGFSMVAAIILENPMNTLVNINFNAILAILYLGILSTGIAFLLQTIAQKKVNANKTAIFLSLEAVFGSVFSVIFLKEIVTFKLLMGALLIFIAIVIAEFER